MVPSLAHFPDLCLEGIFKHVPLVNLIHSVGLVCTNWYNSRNTQLNKRRRLILHQGNLHFDYYYVNCSFGTDLIGRVRRDDGSNWLTLKSRDQIEFNSLTVPDGTRTIPFLASIRTLFSRITQLILIHDYCTNPILAEVIRLVDHFSEHLVELNIRICFDDPDPENDDDDLNEAESEQLVHNLFACLNRLQSIRHLKLSISNFGYLRIPPEPLSCLTRLTTFSVTLFLTAFRLNDWLYASLNQCAQNVTSIELEDTNIESMFELDHQLSTKFTVLAVSCDAMRYTADELYDAIDQFCTRFGSLTKLRLKSSFDSVPMTVLARYLALLPQLVHLDLQFRNIPPVEVEDELHGEMEEEEEDENEEHVEQVQPEITQVASVMLLTLTFAYKSHHHTEGLFIAEIFPNLQVLELEDGFSQCHYCEIGPREGGGLYRIDDTEPELAHRIAECVRLARRPFRRCAKLHTVSLGLNQFFGKETLITVDEL